MGIRRNAMAMVALPAAILLHSPDTAAQSANLAVTLHVSKVSDVRIHDELLVSTVVRNNSPSIANDVYVDAGQAQWEIFLYELIGSESPECGEIYQFDLDPPEYSYFWSVPSIPAGAEITCTARLRVIRTPDSQQSALYASARPHPSTPDPDLSDNSAQASISFGRPAAAHAIPINSWWALAVTSLGILFGGIRPQGRSWGWTGQSQLGVMHDDFDSQARNRR